MLFISCLWEDMHNHGIDLFLLNKHSVRILHPLLVVHQRFPSECLPVSWNAWRGTFRKKLNQNHKLPVRKTERLRVILHVSKLRWLRSRENNKYVIYLQQEVILSISITIPRLNTEFTPRVLTFLIFSQLCPDQLLNISAAPTAVSLENFPAAYAPIKKLHQELFL